MDTPFTPHTQRRSRRLAASALALALALVPALAIAQAGAADPAPSPSPQPPDQRLPIVVEKVTVSATVAEEAGSTVSATRLGPEEIASRNRGQDLAMLLGETPNAYAYSDAGNGVGYSYLSLRGFDQRRIAVYVNGVPLNDPESLQVYFIDLADLAGGLSQIQVQRGTGSALYGSPAVGGVVNLETGAIAAGNGGELLLGGGSYGTLRGSARYRASWDGGRQALQGRVAHVRSDGYRDPAWTRHTLAEIGYQRTGASSVLRVFAFGGPEKTQLAYYGVPIANLRGDVSGDASVDRRVNPLLDGEIDSFFQPQLQVLHDWQPRPGLLVKNAAYAIFGDGYFRQYSQTFDYAPLGPEPPTAEYPQLVLTDAWRRRAVFKTQLGWVPSLSLDHARGRLAVGLELKAASTHHDGSVPEGSFCAATDETGTCVQPGAAIAAPLTLYDYSNHKRSASLWLRESFEATPRLRLQLELQATHHGFSMDDDQVRGYSWETGYSFLTPRLGVSFAANDRLSLHGSVSTARSEPRFDSVWDTQDPWLSPEGLFEQSDGRHYSDATARPERLLAWEAGAAWRGKGATLELNGYWMDFEDELVYGGGINDDGLPITDNAARSLHRGLEASVSLKLPARFELRASLAASDDRLKEYLLQFGPTPADQVDYSGNRIAFFPTHQARLHLSREQGALRLGFGVRRVGTIYLDNSENERLDPAARTAPGYVDKLIDPFTVAELDGRLDLGRLFGGGRPAALVFRVENLFDARYSASGYAYGEPYFIPAATRSAYLTLTLGF